VELYRELGDEIKTIKLDAVEQQKAAALARDFVAIAPGKLEDDHEAAHRRRIEQDGGTFAQRRLARGFNLNDEHLVGCLHVLELLTVMRKQACAALLREEGVMPPDVYQRLIDDTRQFLEAQGHYGIYRMAKQHPALDTFLHRDARIITVPFREGRETGLVMPQSSVTRAAYLGGEEAYLDRSSWMDNWMDNAAREKYMEDIYAQSMGPWYLTAFREKDAAINAATHRHVLAEHDLTLQSLTNLPSARNADSLEYDRFKRDSARYVAKHGLALMQPEIVQVLERVGKFTPMNSRALDQGFHYGYHPPYLPHIHELAGRMNGAGHTGAVVAEPPANHRDRIAGGGGERKSLPAPDSGRQRESWREKLLGRRSEQGAHEPN
jgi:hypothetical protein